MQLQENTFFANRYQLIRLLGRGGFSEVWLAKDNWTHLQVALKVYAPGQGMDQDGLQDFCGELASVYDLNHTNLLKPQHVDTWENMPYLIMAYCPAGSCVKRVGKMTEAELWKLIHDVAAGLAYLHEKDVVHQDIKPDNILMDTEGNYLITDFGISTRARSTLRKSVIGGSTSGGTTAYMGPERFSRQPAPTKASDIWSFGAMAFELLEGVTPFGEIGGGMQKGGAEIPFINAPVSDALKYTIFKMLSKETWDRPTAATLIEWASNPDAIEVDYDLLTEESSTDQPQPAPYTPAIEEVTTGRETQRFGSPSAANDTNATIAFGSAASEELTISVNPEAINVPAEGGNAIVYVNTNGEWTLPKATTQDWIRTTKYSDSAFTIKFDANKTGKVREYSLRVPAKNASDNKYADVVIKQPSLTKKSRVWIWLCLAAVLGILLPIVLMQDQTTLSVSTSSINASADGQTSTITVFCNTTWEIDRPKGNIYSTSMNGNTISVKVTQNKKEANRNESFNIITADGKCSQQISISQSGKVYSLDVNPTNITDTGTGGTIKINVNTNASSWSINSLPSWCSTQNKTSNSFVLSVKANTSTTNRTGTFSIKAGNQTQQITITQSAGQATPKFVPKTVTIDSKIKRTDYHLWKIISIELTSTKTILYERVTPTIKETYVYCDGTEFIEDAQTGKKYYLKYSDLGTQQKPKMLYNDAPLNYTSTYPALPMSVKCINIYDGSTYVVKNLKIR